MIVLREINKTEYEKVEPILKEVGLLDDLSKGIIYLLIDNTNIIGLGKIRQEDNYGVLEYIVIKKEYRGSDLGDSILRSLLFKANAIGIGKVFYSNQDDYLLKKGFKHDDKKTNKFYQLYLDIDKFFNKKCCGDKNGL